jgi:hypothetical protein
MGDLKKAKEAWNEAFGSNKVGPGVRGRGRGGAGSDLSFYRAFCLKKLGKP